MATRHLPKTTTMPKQTFYNLPDAKRARIIAVALDEFGEHDLPSASVSRIVANAGIAKGSFYQYFTDIEDLYHYLFQLAGEKKGALFAANPPPAGMNIFTYMRWLAEQGIAFEAAEPELARLGSTALRSNALPSPFLAQARAMTLQFFQQLVAQGKEQGDIDPGVDDDLAAFLCSTIFGELGQHLFRRLDSAARADAGARQALFTSIEAQQLLDQVIAILEYGLRRHPDSPEKIR